MELYDYFKKLRNKHIAHDDNPYMQCIPGAALNRPDAKNKIAGIQCLIGVAETLDQGNCNNLQKMVLDTLSHIAARFNSLCNEGCGARGPPYEELAAMDDVTYSKPELEDIGKSRDSPLKSINIQEIPEHTDILTPKDLFQKEVRYTIPPFQRPYVWSQEILGTALGRCPQRGRKLS